MFTVFNRLFTGFLGLIIATLLLTPQANTTYAQGTSPQDNHPAGASDPAPGSGLPGNDLPQDLITQVSYDQKVGAQLPLDLSFTDDQGRPVHLRDYFGQKPVVMILAYYDCTMLCEQALADLAANLQQLQWTPGKEFELLTISFNPQNDTALAAQKKSDYMKIYNRPEAAGGWSFLTGDQQNIDLLTQSVGFHYVYDPRSKEYAHPTGVIVFTPQGRISRYIFGIHYGARDLRLALVDASAQKIGTIIDQFFLLCYHYNPVSGQYDLLVTNILKVAGVGTAALLAGMVVFLSKQEKKKTLQDKWSGERHDQF